MEKLKKSKSSFSLGEQSQLAKVICAQIVLLKEKTFDEKNKLIEIYSKNLALILGENAKGYLYYCSPNTPSMSFNPVELIKIYVHELVEDATNVLDITMLPDEKGFNSLDQEYKEKYGKPHIPADNHENEALNNQEDRSGSYAGARDYGWKFKMLKIVFAEYNEPMLNLHFMGPFLKNSQSSLGNYDLIFTMIESQPLQQRTLIIDNLIGELEIILKVMQRADYAPVKEIRKIMPIYHIIIYMFLNV